MTCRHLNADHLFPDDEFAMSDWAPNHADVVLVEQFRCLDCAAWLSLGPSNDAIPPAEMCLAGELADNAVLWEPGAERDTADAHCVEWAVGR